jgi:hypothetical protein
MTDMLNPLIDWLKHALPSASLQNGLLGFGLFVFMLVASLLAVGLVLVKLPADYFSPQHAREFWGDKPRAVRWAGLVVKNIVGLLLVLLGIVLSLPGIPGQGLLTILLGLVMLDIPGLRPLESRLVRIPAVKKAIDKLRARFGKAPMIID